MINKRGGFARYLPHGAFVAAILAILVHALAAPRNHDESQYVAAAALSRHLLIFRDFLSLQTPLCAWLYAPLAAMFAGHAFIAMRLATAITALLTLLLVHRTQRRLGVAPADAALSTLLFAGCGSFLFSASVARNDMLPAMLCALALWIWSGEGGARRHLLAGLCLGLAVSAKISYGPSALAPLVVWSIDATAERRRTIPAYLLGLGAGLVPVAIVVAIAPLAVRYGVLTFGSTAPFEWYRANGFASSLSAGAKAVDCARILATGPAAVALIMVIARRRWPEPDRLLFALLIGGLLGLIAPTPTQLQYALPLLPPLFVLLGRRSGELTGRPARTAVVALLAVFAAIGVAGTIRDLARSVRGGLPVLRLAADAHLVGRILDRDGRGGAIATLSPDRVIDSGHPLDPRFATGPFFYRSGTLVDPALAERLHAATPATLAKDLDTAPPLAILTGGERNAGRFRLDPEMSIAAYANRHGYRPIHLPHGELTLWLRPPMKRGEVIARTGRTPPRGPSACAARSCRHSGG